MSARTLVHLILPIGLAASPAASTSQSLTLEDLAALQRASIEAEARRALTKPETAGPSGGPAVPVPAIAVIPQSSAHGHGAPATALGRPGTDRLTLPRMAVAGMAGSRDTWVVEFTTDNGPLLLHVGDLVPGSNWRVVGVGPRSVKVERVSSTRPGRAPRKSQRVLEPGDAGPHSDD